MVSRLSTYIVIRSRIKILKMITIRSKKIPDPLKAASALNL